MKRYRILYILMSLVFWSACSEDEITPGIDFSNPYEIKDDANDPVQHKRYELFKTYGVPVFFSDTVSYVHIRDDYYGNPIYKYERLDLNWSFTSNTSSSVKYEYDYLTDVNDKLKALHVAETFLDKASVPMRPFCILLTDTVRAITSNETKKDKYVNGYRTLVLAQLLDLEDEEVDEMCTDMLRALVKNRVLNYNNMIAKFKYVSSQNKWYSRLWEAVNNNGGLGCDPEIIHGESLAWTPNSLFEEWQINSLKKDFGYTDEEIVEIQRNCLAEIGRFGFICGDKNVSWRESPTDDFDLETYINTILELGKDKFLERYGASPLVVRKFNILYEVINGELGVEL